MICELHPFEPRAHGIPWPPSCPACAEEAAARIDANAGRTPADVATERHVEIVRKRLTLPARERRALREQGV